MKASFKVQYDGVMFQQPECRLKIDENGGITCLVRMLGVWQPVKGELIDFKIVSNSENVKQTSEKPHEKAKHRLRRY